MCDDNLLVEKSRTNTDGQPFIRVDKLTAGISPSPQESRPRGLSRFPAALVGGPSGIETLSQDETGKMRLFNAAFIVNAAVLIVGLTCIAVAISFATGPKGTAVDWLLIVLPSLVAGFALIGMTWGMCLLVTPTEVIVRGHLTSRRVSISEIISAKTCERLLALKAVYELDLITDSDGTIRTPLVATRSLAGRATVDQACSALNVALTQRRPPE